MKFFFKQILTLMKYLKIFTLLFATLSLSSCFNKDDMFDTNAQYEIEKPLIKEYVENNIPGATLDSATGIWFQVIDLGDEPTYVYKTLGAGGGIESPIIRVKYTLRLLNGSVVDKVDTEQGFSSSLIDLIQAWHIAFLPKRIGEIQVGGFTTNGLQKNAKIRFVTPSIWGYQNRAFGNVPANSPLDFTIEVLGVQAPSNTVN